MNKFLFKHPVVGVLLLIGGAAASLVVAGMIYDRLFEQLGAYAVLAVCIAILVLMVLAGNRHFS